MNLIVNICYWVLLSGVLASAAYYLFCLYSSYKFLRHSSRTLPPLEPFTPPVSILKPVRGVDERAYECFASFCRQDYPDYEIIFGLRDASDPAIKLIECLK